MKNETRARSLAKTIAYRVVAIALLAVVTFAFTGNPGETTIITLIFNAGGAAAYYGLERLWDAIEWGRQPEETKQGRIGSADSTPNQVPIRDFASEKGREGVHP